MALSGSKGDCEQLKQDLLGFLTQELRLTLSSVKTKVTHATAGKALFLGTWIRLTSQRSKPVWAVAYEGVTKIVPVFPRPQLLAPISSIVERLVEEGFAKRGREGNPTRVGRFIHLPLSEIVQRYTMIARGYLNYYSFVRNYVRMKARVLYILQYSLALTIASKMKLRTKRKVFKTYGPHLKVRGEGGKSFEFNLSEFPASAPGFKVGV